jgi:hypothetical protein
MVFSTPHRVISPTLRPMNFSTPRPMIFLILSLSKDAENHPAPTFANVFLKGKST